jgi:hypothetical protein
LKSTLDLNEKNNITITFNENDIWNIIVNKITDNFGIQSVGKRESRMLEK